MVDVQDLDDRDDYLNFFLEPDRTQLARTFIHLVNIPLFVDSPDIVSYIR